MGSTGNPARLQIEALFVGLPHGEGLARQGAIAHDRPEKIVLRYRRQIKADISRLTPEAGHSLFTMDVVNARLRATFQILVEEILQGGDFQRQ